jgi:alanyl-tRNA synthetase
MSIISSVEKLYMWNPSLRSAATHVTSIDQDEKGRFVRLAQSIFHPQGGGQPFDIGTLIKENGDAVSVVGVQKELDPSNPLQQIQNTFEIKHYLQGDDISLKEGDYVEMTIDPERRELNTRLHSAGHLIAAVVNERFPSLVATGGHHIPGEARVEFKLASPEEGGIATYKQRVSDSLPTDLAAKIEESSSVQIHRSEEGGRSIQIGEYAAVPCGGTHVENVGSISHVDIKSVNSKKDTLKVSYTV